jgi:crotonobetainyl-CoA:carnitine CoA-transferase CaiB-like acyl-CoA transferase
MAGPLQGIRVADLTRGIAGPHATKLLADYGATVTKVEPPEGDPARHWGPFKDDVPNPDASAPFLWLNTNKRSVVADLTGADGRDLARRVTASSHVMVEDYRPGELAGLGLDPAALRAANPSLVVCSITPFGQSGPYAMMAGGDIVLQAMGGAMYATGHAEREPLRLGGNYAEWHAGLAAALAMMLAVYRAEATGEGEQIDLSIYETQAGGKDRRQLALVAHAYSGVVMRRHDTAFAICSGVRPCSDGYINLLGNGPRLPDVLRMIGREDLLARPEVHGPEELIPVELAEEIEASYLGWTISHTMDEALEIAQQHRILGGTVHSVADMLSDPEFRARGLWETVDHPVAGAVEYPSRPFVMSDSPRPPACRAPLLGEHTEEVRRELAGNSSWTAIPARTGRPVQVARAHSTRRPAEPDPRLPLAGVRVIDLTVVWAGPFGSQLLAEWGAEVIRLEPLTAVQPQTRGVERAGFLTRELVEQAVVRGALTAGYPNADPLPDPWNRGALFNSSSSNKLSFTGNLMMPAVRDHFERLVAVSDVVIENNVPSTAEKMGITYDRLRAINPEVILVRMPGFGLSGRRANYRCWGNHLEGMAGHHIVRAYPDMTLDAVGETYACDSIAGLTAALAATMALRHRAQTGRGQQVEVPQIEAFAQMMGTEILDYTINGRVAGAMGNDHRSHAPHGAYRCAGEDRWIAIDAGSEEHWRALCNVLGEPALATEPRFVGMVARWQHRRELDAVVGGLTRSWDREELFQRLQAAGVPAGPVQDDGDCFRCPHLAERGFFQEQTRADIGTFCYPGMLFQWTETPNRHRRPPVRLGEDNDYVYRGILGVSDESYRGLIESGEAGTTYPVSILRPGGP